MNLRPITYANSAYPEFGTQQNLDVFHFNTAVSLFFNFSNFDMQRFHKFSAKNDLFTSSDIKNQGIK